MHEATETTTTEAAALPAMIDLGRQHHALWRKVNAHDKQALALRAAGEEQAQAHARDAMAAATLQAEAIEELMLTQPIASLADAAALAVIGHGVSERTDDGDNAVMRRAFARLAVLLSEQAGIPLSELGCGGAARCIVRDAISGEIAL